MTELDRSDSSGPAPAVTRIRTAKPSQARPERPSVLNGNAAPVVVKVPPPFAVRTCQFFWAINFVLAATAIVFFFVIREDQLPLIADAIRAVEADRPDETYDKAADIVYWSVFGVMIALLLVQITLMVSFMNRKPGTRWWQLVTLGAQLLLFGLGRELIAGGENEESIRQLLAGQIVAVTLALLISNLPSAIRWTARRHDVRRGLGEVAGIGGEA